MSLMHEDPKTDRVSLEGLDPDTALRALLKVDPDAEPVEQDKPAERQDDQDQAESAS
jgi:hypothetical protein